MIALTLNSLIEETVFINPSNIIAVVPTNEGTTDVVCLSQTIFEVKETPLQVLNLINNHFN